MSVRSHESILYIVIFKTIDLQTVRKGADTCAVSRGGFTSDLLLRSDFVMSWVVEAAAASAGG